MSAIFITVLLWILVFFYIQVLMKNFIWLN